MMSDEEVIENLLQRLRKALEEENRARLNDEDDQEAIVEIEHTTKCLEAFGLGDREIMDRVSILR